MHSCMHALINMADGQGNLSSALTQEKLAESLSNFANDDTSKIGELIGSMGRLTQDSLTNEEEKVLRFIKEIEREFVVTSLADTKSNLSKQKQSKLNARRDELIDYCKHNFIDFPKDKRRVTRSGKTANEKLSRDIIALVNFALTRQLTSELRHIF